MVYTKQQLNDFRSFFNTTEQQGSLATLPSSLKTPDERYYFVREKIAECQKAKALEEAHTNPDILKRFGTIASWQLGIYNNLDNLYDLDYNYTRQRTKNAYARKTAINTAAAVFELMLIAIIGTEVKIYGHSINDHIYVHSDDLRRRPHTDTNFKNLAVGIAISTLAAAVAGAGRYKLVQNPGSTISEARAEINRQYQDKVYAIHGLTAVDAYCLTHPVTNPEKG